MKTEIFYDYIDNQNILSDSSLNNIEELLNEYPYFQTARTLHLINLYNISDIKFENFLKYNAVFIPDRKLLFQKIHFENINTARNTLINKEDERNSPKIDILELINDAKENDESSDSIFDTIEEISAIEENPENIIPIEISAIEETIVEEKLTQETHNGQEESLDDSIIQQNYETKENEESSEIIPDTITEISATEENAENIIPVEIAAVEETNNEQEESLADRIIRQINEAKENGESSDSIFDTVKEISTMEENQENIISVEVSVTEETIVEEKLTQETDKEQEESLADRILRQINEAKENGESSDSIFDTVKEISTMEENQENIISVEVSVTEETIVEEKLTQETDKEQEESLADRILRQINEAKENGESSDSIFDTVKEISTMEENQENIIPAEITAIEEIIVEEKITQETKNEQEESLADRILRQINEAKENGESSDSIFDTVKEISVIEENQENIIPAEITAIEEKIVEEKITQETKNEQEESLADRILRQINEAKENGESSDSIFNTVKEISESVDNIGKNIIIIEKEKQEKENLIDKFIKEEPRIIADRNYVSKTKKLEESSNNIFTEKLAEIYVKQKLYDRAIEIYHKLNLKNSEKSVYFAEKIKKVEELKNNNKKT